MATKECNLVQTLQGLLGKEGYGSGTVRAVDAFCSGHLFLGCGLQEESLVLPQGPGQSIAMLLGGSSMQHSRHRSVLK